MILNVVSRMVVGSLIHGVPCYPVKIYNFGNKMLSLVIFRLPWIYLQNGPPQAPYNGLQLSHL